VVLVRALSRRMRRTRGTKKCRVGRLKLLSLNDEYVAEPWFGDGRVEEWQASWTGKGWCHSREPAWKVLVCGGLASRSVGTRDGVTISVPRRSEDLQTTGGQRYVCVESHEEQHVSCGIRRLVEANRSP